MTIIIEKSLSDFDFWCGAKDNADSLTYSQMGEVENILEDLYPDGATATQINDLFWFEFDTIKEWLGIEDEDEDE